MINDLRAIIALSAGLGAATLTASSPDRDTRRCETGSSPPAGGFDPVKLVRSADVILLARVDSAVSFTDRPKLGPRDSVHFTVLEVIDSGGRTAPATLAVLGSVSGAAAYNTSSVPYRWSRPEALRGPCYAYTYQRGGEYLLLLKRARPRGELTPYWAGLQPTNEQVHGAADPWVSWVRARRSERRR